MHQQALTIVVFPSKGSGFPGMSLSLKRNISFALLGRIVYALTQFGILAAVAQLGKAEDVGALTLASSIVTPLFFLTSMGMRDVHAVDDLDDFTRVDYVALRLLGSAVAAALTMLVVAIFYRDAQMLVVVTVFGFVLVKAAGAQMSLNHGIFQRAERMDYEAFSNSARGISAFVAFLVAFWATRNLPLSLVAEAVMMAVGYFAIDRRLLDRIGARTRMSELRQVDLRKILRLAWWVMPIGIALWLTRGAISAPPIVLEWHTDLATVGVFGALAYVHSALSMVANTIGGAAAPRLRRHYRNGDRTGYMSLAKRLALTSTGLGVVAVVVAWSIGEPLLGLVFGQEYRQGELFTLIMLGTAISIAGAPFAAAINASQSFRRRLVTAVAVFSVAGVASVVMIPDLGAFGAAWALVALAATQTGLNIVMLGFVIRNMPRASV
ncbi:lipopolysaccharide biosynthesis protein [Aestuariicoccus sp. MJ-SS9]|uniref:lipopolysaccharide biosynthesis protein n=1 Tax=Aestuariicoccus sp. MJ-SS9 TaxID=3079855 RepID=UPI00290A235D|nr:oligosaccharide flippase family protein [Aestuariicoccus sp. MJ-SS9]MDU8913854.1 oligosaccharide flippase family protein [Aestuariicoccus sp. MJ-SS9]